MYKYYNFRRARECIKFTIVNLGIREMYIPYYLCSAVRHTLMENDCKPIFYHIDDNFMPDINFPKESYILYPNYFGIFRKNVEQLTSLYPKLIVDNAHDFYNKPSGCVCFNSGIKFGYGEFAQLWINDKAAACINQREDTIDDFEINLLKKQKCRNKFLEFHKTYFGINELYIDIKEEFYPFCYPLLAPSVEHADKIVKELSRQGLTIYRYWNTLPKSFNEYKFYSRLVPIPIG